MRIQLQITNGDLDTKLESIELAIRARRKAQREEQACDEHQFYYDIDCNDDRDSEDDYPKKITQYCDDCEHRNNLYIGDDELKKIWEVLSKAT